MPKGIYEDLTGQTFNNLTVIGRGETKVTPGGQKKLTWLCRCKCGRLTQVGTWHLRNGGIKSCFYCGNAKSHESRIKHGKYGTRIYRIWIGMHSRCRDVCDKDYGGRGISVCEDWSEFENFYRWAISNGYSENLTIDRIDNDGNYEPSNCRWTTLEQQANNRRTNKYIVVNGRKYSFAEAAREFGVSETQVRYRYLQGLSGDEIVSKERKPTMINGGHLYKGKRYSRQQLSDMFGIKVSTFSCRFARGWSIEEIAQGHRNK